MVSPIIFLLIFRFKIVHIKDVKGGHILVTENYIIKLIDFGVAAFFNNEKPRRNSSVGTSLWMAPVR